MDEIDEDNSFAVEKEAKEFEKLCLWPNSIIAGNIDRRSKKLGAGEAQRRDGGIQGIGPCLPDSRQRHGF